MKKIINIFFIIINIFKNNNTKVLFFKFLKKFEINQSKQAKEWANAKAENYEDYCKSFDKNLWIETKEYCEKAIKNSRIILNNLPIKLSGQANIFLIYFLVRKFKPKIVFETGVSAGWSSMAILDAFKRNSFGELYSTDFPDQKNFNVEKYTGILVREKNPKNWTLDMNGDEIALNRFIRNIKSNYIDFFHYDSDKSFSGRKLAFELIKKKLSSNSIVIFDDIGDNLYFKNLVENEKLKYKIFNFKNGFVGLIFNYKN